MSRRSIVLGVSLLAGLAALPGCGAQAPDGEASGEPVGSTAQPIMGGTDDATDLPVVDIIWLMGNGFAECSGSLLAPNMVLTAHHCVSQVQGSINGGVSCQASSFSAPDVPSNFYVSTLEFLNLNNPNANNFHMVRQIVVPPNSTNTTFCGVDQAILILSDNVAPSEAVPLVPRVDTHINNGDEYTAIGFGITSDGNTDSGTRRRLGGLHVNCVGSSCASVAPGALDVTHEFIGDHGTCEGDSGGPALDQQNRVVGVTSRGSAGCQTPIYGDVYDWGAWIKQTAMQAAQLGGYTAPPWATGYPTDPAYGYPVGGACGASCASNICLQDNAGSYCSRLCETAAPCPSGYMCNTVQNLQICQRPNPMPQSSGTGGGGTNGAVVFPNASSGCSVQAADPTKPVPWFVGAGLAALALVRRRLTRARARPVADTLRSARLG